MTTVFVTATGTEVGKTFVCCRLIEAIGNDRALRVIKPVASGVDLDALETTDTALLLDAQGIPLGKADFERATPWHYRAAMSPDMAATREGKSIPFGQLVDFCAGVVNEPQTLTIIEGIGGAMVPLDESHTVLDWMVAVGPTVWLVAGTYLGSISHTLTTLQSLDSARLTVGAIVLSESPESPATIDEIATAIRRFAGNVPVVELSRPPIEDQIARLTNLLPP